MWLLPLTLLAVMSVLGIGIWLGVTNTRLKTRRLVADHARQGLDLQIKRRLEVVESILDPIQRDASFDLESTDNVAFLAGQAKKAATFTERSHFETALADSLRDLLVAVDNSPETSVDESYVRARYQLSEAENSLRNARRFYNDSVQQYNAILETFPNRFIAAMFSFAPLEMVEIASTIPDEASPSSEPSLSLVPAPKGRRMTAKKV